MSNKLNKPGSTVSLWSVMAGIIVTIIGLMVLLGWQLDIGFLKSILPGTVSMKANTAVGFLFSGLALIFIQRSTTINIIIERFLAAIILFTGLLTLCQYFLGWNLGIDEMLFRDSIDAVG